MARRPHRRPAPPLDEARLRELALAYVGRYSTTRAKLRAYLARKIRERGWSGEREFDLAALADAIAERGYIDDSAYALAKSQALTGRGYGRRRVMDKLRAAGVGEADGSSARAYAEAEAVSAALRFAERRRIGPFAAERKEPGEREKAIAAMIRAGHAFALARAIVDLGPGDPVDVQELEDRARLTAA
jgi:regulatory protein